MPWSTRGPRSQLHLGGIADGCPEFELAVWQGGSGGWSWLVSSGGSAVTGGGAPTRTEAMRAGLERARAVLPPACHQDIDRELTALRP